MLIAFSIKQRSTVFLIKIQLPSRLALVTLVEGVDWPTRFHRQITEPNALRCATFFSRSTSARQDLTVTIFPPLRLAKKIFPDKTFLFLFDLVLHGRLCSYLASHRGIEFKMEISYWQNWLRKVFWRFVLSLVVKAKEKKIISQQKIIAWRRLSTIIADLLWEGVFLNGLVVDCVTSELQPLKRNRYALETFNTQLTMTNPSARLGVIYQAVTDFLQLALFLLDVCSRFLSCLTARVGAQRLKLPTICCWGIDTA